MKLSSGRPSSFHHLLMTSNTSNIDPYEYVNKNVLKAQLALQMTSLQQWMVAFQIKEFELYQSVKKLVLGAGMVDK